MAKEFCLLPWSVRNYILCIHTNAQRCEQITPLPLLCRSRRRLRSIFTCVDWRTSRYISVDDLNACRLVSKQAYLKVSSRILAFLSKSHDLHISYSSCMFHQPRNTLTITQYLVSYWSWPSTGTPRDHFHCSSCTQSILAISNPSINGCFTYQTFQI